MKTVVFDIDGIILDFNKVLKEWIYEKYSIELDYNPANYGYNYEDDPAFCDKLMKFVKHHEKHFPLLYPDMPDLMKKLHENGYNIVLITAYSGSRKRRVENLKEHDIDYNQLIFDSNKLPHVQKLNPILCIEDRPGTIKKYAEAGYKVAVPKFWNYCKEVLDIDNVFGYDNTEQLYTYIKEQ
jgi:hypothetical protein